MLSSLINLRHGFRILCGRGPVSTTYSPLLAPTCAESQVTKSHTSAA